MESSHIFSIEVQVILFSFSSCDVIDFFKNRREVLDVTNVSCYCCLILLFVLT